MQRFKLFASSAAMFALPLAFASAQGGLATDGTGGPFELLLANILTFTNAVLIPFIIGIGFLVFVWGMFQYFIAGGANDESKEKGKSLMIWATLGFVLIIIFWGVVNLLTQSTGLQDNDILSVPTVLEL
ncbi:MAG: hypothetical protein H6779_04695 [Candidatus Nomurabacteria bacterium]|nr:hypothetical protein [Candidatus Nomurabacteria bacterium]USN87672.1 MAG: hypothetical protein H6779_04695 [Candidatus Nomurabacteria bacterium]